MRDVFPGRGQISLLPASILCYLPGLSLTDSLPMPGEIQGQSSPLTVNYRLPACKRHPCPCFLCSLLPAGTPRPWSVGNIALFLRGIFEGDQVGLQQYLYPTSGFPWILVQPLNYRMSLVPLKKL